MLFRYLAARWRHPGAPTRRYIQAGLGLESRARALSVFWTDHLSRTRAAQSRWAQNSQGKLLTVLGAGPLLDLNTPALAPKFQSFRLVDANPLLVDDWRRLNIPVEPVITDITNCMAPWCEKIKTFRGDWEQTLNVIRDLGNAPVEAYSAPTDALLSLNILSQLEIGWQEALEPLLRKKFGTRFVLAHEQVWLNAIRPSARMLIEQHLKALQTSAARNILLICDIDYIEYKGRHYTRHQWAEPPLTWTPDAWLAADGITYELDSALEGVLLNSETFSRLLPSYILDWHDTWLWHIAPNGTEGTDYGKLHRVAAFALRYFESAPA